MCKTNTSLARVEKYSAVDEALNLIYLYIQEVYSPKEVELICGELKSIARRDDFQCVEVASSKRTYTQVQDALSKINEKQSIRKAKGYITPQMMLSGLSSRIVLKPHSESLQHPMLVI